MLDTCKPRLSKVVAAAGLLAAWTAWCAKPGSPRSDHPVSLYVTVEEKGGLVQGLTADDFKLYEDGRARPFQLEPIEGPTSIAVLLENSQSSWGLFYEDIQFAMQGLVDAAPEGNWYALATFNHAVHIEVDFTKQIGKISAAFANLAQPLWDEADTYDAVYEMLDRLERLPGRRVLIFIGSGLDSFSAHTLDDMEKKMESANVLFYGAGLGSVLRGMYEPYLGPLRRMNLLEARSFLTSLAEKSGGEAWLPKEESAFPDVMKGIMQSLANQYRLVYNSQAPPDGKLHKVKVEVSAISESKRREFKVRAREGWREY